jgi:prophage endopeptidase
VSIVVWFLERWRIVLAAAAIVAIVVLWQDASALRRGVHAQKTTIDQQASTITAQRAAQAVVAAIDFKRTKELSDAQDKIDILERAVDAGTKQLRISATCTPATSTSVGNGTGPRLTDAAQRDYYTLRRRINTVTLQLNTLQDYINALPKR